MSKFSSWIPLLGRLIRTCVKISTKKRISSLKLPHTLASREPFLTVSSHLASMAMRASINSLKDFIHRSKVSVCWIVCHLPRQKITQAMSQQKFQLLPSRRRVQLIAGHRSWMQRLRIGRTEVDKLRPLALRAVQEGFAKEVQIQLVSTMSSIWRS